MQPIEIDEYTMTAEDVANKLKYTVEYVRILAGNGGLRAVRRGRRWYFKPEDLVRLYSRPQVTIEDKGTPHESSTDGIGNLLR